MAIEPENATSSLETEADKARLRREIADLKRDLAAITKTLTDKGIDLLDDLTEDDEPTTFEEIRARGREAAANLGHQARKIAETPTQNSVATLMIIAGLGVVIGMLAR